MGGDALPVRTEPRGLTFGTVVVVVGTVVGTVVVFGTVGVSAGAASEAAANEASTLAATTIAASCRASARTNASNTGCARRWAAMRSSSSTASAAAVAAASDAAVLATSAHTTAGGAFGCCLGVPAGSGGFIDPLAELLEAFGLALTFGAGFGAAGSRDGIAQVLLDALQPLDHEVKEVAKSPLTKSRKW